MALVEGTTPGAVTALVRAFTDWLHEERCKRRLKRILQNPGYHFDTIAHLSAISGTDLDITQRLLRAIGARPSETDLTIWTLRQPRVF